MLFDGEPQAFRKNPFPGGFAMAATISVWGVGTRLVTGHEDGALGGVCKLSAVRRPGGPWRHRIKLFRMHTWDP